MAKIGTAHIEIKPVLNEEALAALAARIEAEVASAVLRGLSSDLVSAWSGELIRTIPSTDEDSP